MAKKTARQDLLVQVEKAITQHHTPPVARPTPPARAEYPEHLRLMIGHAYE